MESGAGTLQEKNNDKALEDRRPKRRRGEGEKGRRGEGGSRRNTY